ncbi:MAG: hypothetical protein G01um101433_583 [Parcubacteria group bacterium Gr01-1014_33]|nr:MAG: hypothetical protein G01um101433_583 [Parcubacteria group bacterium Gr01-1014_33]
MLNTYGFLCILSIYELKVVERINDFQIIMEHYICKGGCKGVSDTAGVCQTKGCPNYGKPLEKCDCGDGKHHGRFEDEKEVPTGEEEEHGTNA